VPCNFVGVSPLALCASGTATANAPLDDGNAQAAVRPAPGDSLPLEIIFGQHEHLNSAATRAGSVRGLERDQTC
jgi:hypothetical protein